MRLARLQLARWTLLALGVLVAGSGWMLRPEMLRSLRGERTDNERLVADVLAIIRQHYADSLPDEELGLRAVEGILRNLPDTYSSLMLDHDLRGYRDLLAGTSGAVGVRLLDGPLGLTVAEVAPGSPADAKGIRMGQRVLAIEDASVAGWSALRGEQALRGEPGSVLRLRVRSPGSAEAPTIAIRRERFRSLAPMVRALAPGVGYIRLGTVTRGATRSLEGAVTRMVREGAHGIVLDLRDNPGGLLDEATALLDLFLNRGMRLGTVAGRSAVGSRAIVSGSRERWPGLRVVVLVNPATASAAEIIAAGLKENRRATIVGEHTFGKGFVQSTVRLGPNLAVRISTARWLTPGGRRLDRSSAGPGGVEPDLVVPPWHSSPGDDSLGVLIGPRGDEFRLGLERALARREWTPPAPADTMPSPEAGYRRLAKRLRVAGFAVTPRQLAAAAGLLRQEYAVLAAARSEHPDARPSGGGGGGAGADRQLLAAMRYLELPVAGGAPPVR
jgi:carboxyl-terminal processing protease